RREPAVAKMFEDSEGVRIFVPACGLEDQFGPPVSVEVPCRRSLALSSIKFGVDSGGRDGRKSTMAIVESQADRSTTRGLRRGLPQGEVERSVSIEVTDRDQFNVVPVLGELHLEARAGKMDLKTVPQPK